MLNTRQIRAWYQVHKWTSLVCTAFLLMLCLTGLPLIFHDEIDGWLKPEAQALDLPASVPDEDLDAIVAQARQYRRGEYLRFLDWDDERPHVLSLAFTTDADSDDFSRAHFMAVDARTGQLLGEDRPAGGFIAFVFELHVRMFAGLPGELFLGLMGLLFAVAIVSGVVVYGPFMRKQAFGVVRRDRSPRLKWLDLHNLLGIVTVAWALVVGLTGVMNTLATPLFGLWAMRTLPPLVAPYRGQAAPMQEQFGSLQKAVESARAALPENEVTSITFPTANLGSPWHYLIWTRGRTPLTSKLLTPVLVDVLNGQRQTAAAPNYIRALELSRPLHFGDYGGLPLKLIWALLDLVTIAVLGSGLYLWLARRRSSASQDVTAWADVAVAEKSA